MNEIFKELTSLIKSHEKVIIMTHKNVDLDGFGASLCLYKIVKSFKKECYIYLNKKGINKTIIKSIDNLIKEDVDIEFINKNKQKTIINENTLLIILDAHKKELLENKSILNLIKDIVVIDHHIVNNNQINKTKLTYINDSSSSTNEIMVNYLKYLNKTVSPVIATIMLAGIEIDTNGFKLKTTEKTYEAAAHLTSLGASNIIKQEILKETKDDYLKRQKYVKNSYMINKNNILCIIDENISDKKDLASIAEELLHFEKVEASFVIGKIKKNTVGVSARSLGNIDVFKVCKKLGGGGHLTNAAAQIANKSIEEVKEMLLKIIK